MRLRIQTFVLSGLLAFGLGTSSLQAEETSLERGVRAHQEAQNHAALNEPRQALEAINRALKEDPDNSTYLRAKAQYLNWVGDPQGAEAIHHQALTKNPKDDEALYRLGQICSWQGRFRESEDYFDRALQLQPDRKEIYLAYANEQSWRGKSWGAVEVLDRHDKRFGVDEESKAIRAKTFLWSGFPKKAQTVEASMAPPNGGGFDRLYIRASAHRARREYPKAVQALADLEKEFNDQEGTTDTVRYVNAVDRSDIYLRGEYYRDWDDIQIITGKLGARFRRQKPGLSVEGWGAWSRLSAPAASGLNHINGDEDAYRTEGRIGVRFLLDPKVEAFLELGGAQTEGNDVIAYRAQMDFRPNDVWHFLAFRDQSYFLVSPRAVSLGIEQAVNELQMMVHPSLRWRIGTTGSYTSLSDNNHRLLGQIWPQYYLLAYAPWHLDVGARGSWMHYSNQLFNGYYSPDLFQSYMGTGRVRYRAGDNSTIEFLATAGVLKDDFTNGLKFGWSAEAYWGVGLVSSWMFEVSAGYIQNLRQAAGAFRMINTSATLTKRF